MSQEDPTSGKPRERRRLPITPMRPYVEPERVQLPKVPEGFKVRLGRAARMIVKELHEIFDPRTQHRDD